MFANARGWSREEGLNGRPCGAGSDRGEAEKAVPFYGAFEAPDKLCGLHLGLGKIVDCGFDHEFGDVGSWRQIDEKLHGGGDILGLED